MFPSPVGEVSNLAGVEYPINSKLYYKENSRTEGMQVTIAQLTATDLGAVDRLMKQYSRTLGFLPRSALQNYLKAEKRRSVGSQDRNGATRWLSPLRG